MGLRWEQTKVKNFSVVRLPQKIGKEDHKGHEDRNFTEGNEGNEDCSRSVGRARHSHASRKPSFASLPSVESLLFSLFLSLRPL